MSHFKEFFQQPQIKSAINSAVLQKVVAYRDAEKAKAAKQAESAISKIADKPISAKQAALPKKKAPDGDRFVSKAAKSNRSKQPPKTYILESYDHFSRPEPLTKRYIDKANASNELVVKRILGTLLEEKNFIRAKIDKIRVAPGLADRLAEFKLLFEGHDVELLEAI
ncbi:hypothetical protein LWV33_03140 [Brucella intermedia]